MWRIFSLEYIRKNRAASLSIALAALIAALFLALLCSLGYNLWKYDVDQILLDEGGWHARIEGAADGANLAAGFAHVARAEARGGDLALYFSPVRATYRDAPRIAEKLGFDADAIRYHESLLSLYFVHDPDDSQPPLLLGFFLLVLLIACGALTLVIHNAFGVSMNARMRQLGALASIGATPAQLRAALLQEAGFLCAAPVLLGVAGGIWLSRAGLGLIENLGAQVRGRRAATFQFHPLVLLAALAAAGLTVFLSAYLPARKLSRRAPLEAMRMGVESAPKRARKPGLLAKLFGVEGELASAALRAQRRALRISNRSLALSFLSFALMLNFLALSDVSTEYTYFERYRDAWDVMAVAPEGAEIDALAAKLDAAELGAADRAVYGRLRAKCFLPESALASALVAAGGPGAVTNGAIVEADGGYLLDADLVILDGASFEAYCAELGVSPGAGAVALNRIWDSAHSHFRERAYLPLLNADCAEIELRGASGAISIPLSAGADAPPRLREEYAEPGLAVFMPASLWRALGEGFGAESPAARVRLLAHPGADVEALDAMAEKLRAALGAAEIENRIRQESENDAALQAFALIIGGFCALLALIGLANALTNALSFGVQRAREFARYTALGMTRGQIRKMLCIEALAVALRPILVALPIAALAVALMLSASRLDPLRYLPRAPIRPLLLFIAATLLPTLLTYVAVSCKRKKSARLKADFM